jgi:L-cystine transport system substrate-binding protein
MMKTARKVSILLALVIVAGFVFSGCSSTVNKTSTASNSSSAGSASSNTSVTKISVGYAQGGIPTEYVDDKGNLTGYDIETLRLVDELLPDYEFTYTGLDQTAVYAGLATGKFQIALSNAFWTPERASKYLFPKENIGASVLGFFTRKTDADVKTLSDAATKKLKLVPILSGDGQYYVIQDYNTANPNNKITIEPTDDSNTFNESFQWLLDKRYDFSLIPKQYWDQLVVAEKGSFHKYDGQFTYRTFGAVKTWAVLEKGQDKLAGEIDTALVKLKSEGKLVALAEKFYGYNTFQNLTADSK